MCNVENNTTQFRIEKYGPLYVFLFSAKFLSLDSFLGHLPREAFAGAVGRAAAAGFLTAATTPR